MIEPIHIISLGAGVQSSTMALMAAAGEITPMPAAAIFADTQDEPAKVYEWLNYLEKQLPFPVIRVTKGRLSNAALRMRVGKDGLNYCSVDVPQHVLKPDGSRGLVTLRGCTEKYKVREIIKASRKVAEIKRGEKEVKVIQWIGISADEADRMKPSRAAWIKHRWPLCDMNMKRRDCVDWLANKGFQLAPRSACVYCAYKGNREWRLMRENAPEDFAKACAFETALQIAKGAGGKPFLHPSCVPLGQVDFSTDVERGQGLLSGMGNECEGMCGV